MRIAGWAEFEGLAAELSATGAFRRTERDGLTFVHRNGTEIDLLPYGVLFAFDDRGDRTTKDLEDLAFILEHATDALHDRAFEELDGHELIARPYEEYGALLLGGDLRARFDDASRERLAAIARRATRRVPSLPGTFRASSSERTDDLVKRFSALEAGILATDG